MTGFDEQNRTLFAHSVSLSIKKNTAALQTIKWFRESIREQREMTGAVYIASNCIVYYSNSSSDNSTQKLQHTTRHTERCVRVCEWNKQTDKKSTLQMTQDAFNGHYVYTIRVLWLVLTVELCRILPLNSCVCVDNFSYIYQHSLWCKWYFKELAINC